MRRAGLLRDGDRAGLAAVPDVGKVGVIVSGAVYDRWRDAEGTHISDGCQVEQVAVNRSHGALRSRLHKRGEVLGRSRGNRLSVRFDGETGPTSLRPHLVRVIEEYGNDR